MRGDLDMVLCAPDLAAHRELFKTLEPATHPMNRLGACSWSLRAETPHALADLVHEVGVTSLQLGLDPLIHGAWQLADVQRAFESRELTIASGMMGMKGEDYTSLDSIRETGGVRPDAHWPANLAAGQQCARIARELGLSLVSFHAGFLPHEREDPERARLLDRLRQLADVFEAQGVRLALETGQETAETLDEVLAELDHPSVGVNFDPANMLLYGMGDPVEALRRLAPHVLQIHIKDAVRSETSGEWGAEVPVGTGEVDWTSFFQVCDDSQLFCGLMIEREAGDERVRDMQTARRLVLGIAGRRVR